jgi:hypothetical protein
MRNTMALKPFISVYFVSADDGADRIIKDLSRCAGQSA